MLANLDNEVHKNVLTDVEIALIKDATRKKFIDRIIRRALTQKKLSTEDIADLFEVSLEYVQKIEKELN